VTRPVIREGCEIEPANKWINGSRTKWNEHTGQMEGNRKVRDSYQTGGGTWEDK
jgi:hypothetical protein